MDEIIFKVGVLEIKYFLMVKFFKDIWYKNGYGYFYCLYFDFDVKIIFFVWIYFNKFIKVVIVYFILRFFDCL